MFTIIGMERLAYSIPQQTMDKHLHRKWLQINRRVVLPKITITHIRIGKRPRIIQVAELPSRST